MNSREDFQRASFTEKCDWVSVSSNFIMARSLGNAKIYLYHSVDFFIEVYYAPTYKKILTISTFSSITGLTPYLDQILLTLLGF